MIINDKIRDEKRQHNIITETARILAWSSVKMGNYEYLTGEEILFSSKSQMIEQAKFTYWLLGIMVKHSKNKKIKNKNKKENIDKYKEKQIEALQILKPTEQQKQKWIEDILPKHLHNNEIKKELKKSKQ